MSVEGMWALLSGDFKNAEFAGGVIVLETNRLFGGDSALAYVGTYEIDGDHMLAKVERWKYNLNYEGTDVWGDRSHNLPAVTFEGKRQLEGDAEVIIGKIWRDEIPEPVLDVTMKKMRDLP